MAKNYPDIKPGQIVSGGFTYPNNAQVVGDVLYLRDANGNVISGRQVDNGDKITVLDVGYTKQITLIQYPAGTAVRQGYVTNSTNIIKYLNQGAWKNGSTSETVYDENDAVLGSLDPYEVATPLYKASNGKTHVVYNTSKGANTKSGYVVYGGGTGSTNPTGGIVPGEVVPGGFTYPNNAQVVGDDLYLRDANGNMISGRQVSNGDRITVLDVGYTKQLVLVQYPAGSVVRQGYVTNATALIKYDRQGEWHNGSTAEEVLDENGAHLGSLNPYEAATPLYKKNGMTHVVYNTDKGPNTKSGYVRYEGSAINPITIPQVSASGAQRIVYGTSGKGRDLAAYKIGSGSNSLVFVCEQHGFEDHWDRDGIELVYIGNDLITSLANSSTNGWTVYVIPSANPDGLIEGYTNNGPGRCTIVGAVDTNRDYPIGFTPHGTTRNWTGDAPLSVSESRSLKGFIERINNDTLGELVVIDLHGWENDAIGNTEIGQYFINQFGFTQKTGYGEDSGYLIAWAKSIGAKATLIELPSSAYSHSDVVSGGYSQKIVTSVKNLIKSMGNNSISDEVPLFVKGQVIDVNSTLNVRSDANISSSIIGSLSPDAYVQIVAEKYYWYKIQYSSGFGYVSKDYIQIIRDGVQPPDTEDENEYWIEDTIRRGWGPITEEEYYRRVNEIFGNNLQQYFLSDLNKKDDFDYTPSQSDIISLCNAFYNNETSAYLLGTKEYDTNKPGFMRVYEYDLNGTRRLIDEYKLKSAPSIPERISVGFSKGARLQFLEGIDKAFNLAGVTVGTFADLVKLEKEGYIHSLRDVAVALAVTTVHNGLTTWVCGIISSTVATIAAPELPVASSIIGGVFGAVAGYVISKKLSDEKTEEYLTNKIEWLLKLLFGE
ncbi:hypothetical protein CFOLD11_32050 [Clostridium folliculivorans]|uniref:Bacteriocin n=1 Tax=Clostridium folliculivorans TaxID=2886038 RepID=A0A9W5Y4J1_9CLOT|nr:SH3 domain-containing protein [Clostridium folliculivorans]GKU26378.1 hypothetical protein CFOLD11_32050 [Clostridium folliculivorans]